MNVTTVYYKNIKVMPRLITDSGKPLQMDGLEFEMLNQ